MNNHQPLFRHMLLIEDHKARRLIALEEQTYTIGRRESSNDIVIYERVISRYHATLLKVKKNTTEQKYYYRIIDGDLQGNKSTNGLIINGRNCEYHNLKHGDIILFGGQAKACYFIVSNSLDIALFNPVESNQLTALFDNLPSLKEHNNSTLVCQEKNGKSSQPEDLTRLASFPELSPNPIIEISFDGEITYINPVTNLQFSNLQQLKLKHPILMGLLDQGKNTQGNLLLR